MSRFKKFTKKVKENFSGTRQNIKTAKKLMKNSGYKRPENYDYETTHDTITIDCKGDKELKDKILKTLDSSIEWGLRLNK